MILDLLSAQHDGEADLILPDGAGCDGAAMPLRCLLCDGKEFGVLVVSLPEKLPAFCANALKIK